MATSRLLKRSRSWLLLQDVQLPGPTAKCRCCRKLKVWDRLSKRDMRVGTGRPTVSVVCRFRYCAKSLLRILVCPIVSVDFSSGNELLFTVG
jgi:hypothetical protein